MFYDYAESGSWTEQTFRDNSSDFDEIRLRQRIAVDMDGRSTAAKMVGQDYAMPVALAPVGLCGMQSADGEIKAAKRRREIRRALHPVDHVDLFDRGRGLEHTAPFWFQVYTLRDDDFMKRLFDRAKAAKCSALVITVDLQIMGQRHKDIKNGLSAPPKLTPASILNLDQGSVGPRDAADPPAHLRQRGGPCQGRLRSRVAGVLDGGGLRPLARLGAHQARIPQPVGRAGDPEGHPRRGRREDGRQCRRRRDRGVEPWRAAT
jgi:isopentenyl diphosphate isomerase/L-lactate dehydrogenase-like FMN-dependent dehydrogenase